MPQEHERYGKNSWEWSGSQPSRSQQRDAAAHDDPSRPTIPSKLKKGKCKGPDGWHPEHDFAFTRERGARDGREKGTCGWAAIGKWDSGSSRYVYTPAWSCTHEERCTRCNHLERYGYQIRNDGDCPSKPDELGTPPASVVRDCEFKQQDADERAAKWKQRIALRKPVIDGPQGYRKKKSDG